VIVSQAGEYAAVLNRAEIQQIFVMQQKKQEEALVLSFLVLKDSCCLDGSLPF